MSDLVSRVAARRSHSRVTPDAPTHEELLPLVAAAGRVADHSALRPWRVIELRGEARVRLGRAFAEDAKLSGRAGDKLAAKALRSSLLLAIVSVRTKSEKVPGWEQDAVASGVAHLLSLLLHDAGWGVIWRTGRHTRSKAVHRMHGLARNERLLGWLYVGGIPEGSKEGHRKTVDPERFLSVPD
ncbi:nitroreductase [Leifsonia xyli subsp. cynodontis DSM 46306]|jgi:nitroreductase|uniref:Putative NAD(P)H nitroreductase n=1 Tax=Leifsonia xyli subsp. cynodontis DSM 46306 TaxID=1389489 RepID=U3PBH8_LEIXC|nr:nitroreductase family protein [Leifsonia xyli]AGW40848.1 nitroreductase [Leifsonia xyli subsp. cynodontis DSM 46306]